MILHLTAASQLQPGYRLPDADYVVRVTLAPSMTKWVVDVERRTSKVGDKPERYADAQIRLPLRGTIWAQHGNNRDPVDTAPVERPVRPSGAGVQTAIDVVAQLSQRGLLGDT